MNTKSTNASVVEESSKARSSIRLTRVLITSIIAVVVAFSMFLLYLYNFKANDADLDGAKYSASPQKIISFKPKDFGLDTFQPIFGAGNGEVPAQFSKLRIIAGKSKTGNTHLIALNAQGTVLWNTDLGAPLVACSRTLSDKSGNGEKPSSLACLYNTGSTSGITMINLTTGKAKLIWQNPAKFVNISAKGNQINLLGDDLSTLQIDTSGTLLKPFIATQTHEDPILIPNLSECNSLAAGPKRPEFFDATRSKTWIVTHNGVNYLIDSYSNQVIAALPGRLMHNSNFTVWAISGQTGCANGAIYNTSDVDPVPLAPGLIIPFGQDSLMPSLSMRDGNFYNYSYENNRPGREAFTLVKFKNAGDENVSVIEKKKGVLLSSDNSLAYISIDKKRELWSVKADIHSFALYSNVVVGLETSGNLTAFSLVDGKQLWKVQAPGMGSEQAWNGFSRDNKSDRFYTASPTDFVIWGPSDSAQVESTSIPPLQEPEPGITFTAGECVRFINSVPDPNQQAAQQAEQEQADSADDDTQDVDKEKEKKRKEAAKKRQQQLNRLSKRSQPLTDVYVEKVVCTLQAAEPISQVIKSDTTPRGGDIKTMWTACSADPSSKSATLINSPTVVPEISGICTSVPTVNSDTNKDPNGQTNPNTSKGDMDVYRGPGWSRH